MPRASWVAVLVIQAAAGCGGDGKQVTSPPTVASVDISPSTATIELSRTTHLTATARSAGGAVIPGLSVAWTTASPAIATVSSDGTVEAIALGATTITATIEGKSGAAAVTVVAPTAPAARWLAGMAYDDAQNRVLMFGGFGASGASLHPLNDLWAWNGQRWSFLGAGGPGARGDMLTAWDGARRRLVVYGGANNDGMLGDTWEWDGTNWRQQATGGPPMRRHFTGGFDQTRSRVVMFGGLIGETPALDTWEWDGQAWAQRASTAPSGFTTPARSMAYSETRKSSLMLVGSFSTGATALWQWNGSAWSSLGAGPTTSMPIPVATSGADEFMMLAGGSTMRWQNGTLSTLATTGLPSVDGASIAYDRSRSRLVLFGGVAGSQTSAETWLWNGSTWGRAP